MSIFSHAITSFWRTAFLNGDVLHSDPGFVVTLNPNLSEDRRVMILEPCEGKVMAVLTPALAAKLDLHGEQNLSETTLRRLLNEAGVALHGADNLFYFSEAGKSALSQGTEDGDLRRLTEQDQAMFSEFQSSASEEDLDGAYVELDHWAVFGAFEQDRLISAASMYPWEGAQIADLGVLTLARFRGRGHARKVVRSISRHAWDRGYEPQYRCQLDNQASIRLAKAAGLTLFGKWDLVSPDSAV